MNPIFAKDWRPGPLLIAALLFAFAPYGAYGQSQPGKDPSNIECLERLEIPEYPGLARQARIQVTQTVKVVLSDQASIKNVEQTLQGKAVNVDRFFRESAEKALKNSRFSKACGGKTITLVFHYELRDDPNTSSLFAFGPPNHFWIRYGPIYINPEVSGK